MKKFLKLFTLLACFTLLFCSSTSIASAASQADAVTPGIVTPDSQVDYVIDTATIKCFVSGPDIHIDVVPGATPQSPTYKNISFINGYDINYYQFLYEVKQLTTPDVNGEYYALWRVKYIYRTW